MAGAIPAIRVLHVLFGAFWVGTGFFHVLILEPRLKALGPKIHQSVMNSIMPPLAPALMASSIIVVATGTTLTLYKRSGVLDTLVTSGWGVSILIGIVATVAAMGVGFGGLMPIGLRMARLGEQTKKLPPTPEQAATLSRLNHRMDVLGRIDFVLLFIAVASTPLAAFL